MPEGRDNRNSSNQKLNITVTGMTCATCARTVEKAISKLDGVKYVAVNLATNQAFLILEKPLEISEIKKAVEKVGYGISLNPPKDIEKIRHARALRNLIISLSLTIPLMALMILHMLGYHIPYFPIIELIITFLVLFVAGFHTLKGAWIAVSHLHANMDTLISIGALTCLTTSILHVLGFHITSFGTIGAMIITLHLVGRYIESSLRDKAFREIRALMELRPKEATVLMDGKEVVVPSEHLKKGMIALVRPGERIPADGIVIEGKSIVDESMITGEPIPAPKFPGSFVTGGTINLNGFLKIQVERSYDESFLAQISKLLAEVQGARIPIQKIADRITNYFVPVILILSVLSFLFWYFNFDRFSPFVLGAKQFLPWVMGTTNKLNFALFAFVSTIVIACPCALGLAIPMALLRGTILASKSGLLIKNAEIIQTISEVGYALFDKTGTLTEGRPRVIFHNLDQEELYKVALIEKKSVHPLAQAISSLVEVEETLEIEVQEIPGTGVRARLKSDEYFVGKPSDFNKYSDHLTGNQTVVEVVKNDETIGYLILEDMLIEESFKAVSDLKRMGIEPVLVTGDNELSAKYVAGKLGIEKVFARMRPEDKVNVVREFQARGKKVLMVGDGINDAPALKSADIAITISHGSDLAIEFSDAIILKGGLSKIVELIQISSKILKKTKENLFWAFLYNLIAIPLAMMGILNPIVAEGAMAMSSISVILNSLRLK